MWREFDLHEYSVKEIIPSTTKFYFPPGIIKRSQESLTIQEDVEEVDSEWHLKTLDQKIEAILSRNSDNLDQRIKEIVKPVECKNCQYFADNQYLKCAVNPNCDAPDCKDYQA